MAHAQKPDFVFRRNGRVHLNRPGASVQSNTGSRGVRISGSNAGYTVFRGSVKGTGYLLHSPVSPSLPLPCVTVCHHISTGVYPHTVASNTAEYQLSGLIGTASYPDMQEIRIIGFFFKNSLHWQFEVQLLVFTVCTASLPLDYA